MKSIHPQVRKRRSASVPATSPLAGVFVGRLLVRHDKTMAQLAAMKGKFLGRPCTWIMWQGDIYVAQRGDKIIGFCRVEAMNMLCDLIIDESERRKGIASKLVKTVIADRTFVYARSERALGQFWSKLGFEPEALLEDIVMWRYARN